MIGSDYCIVVFFNVISIKKKPSINFAKKGISNRLNVPLIVHQQEAQVEMSLAVAVLM